MFFFIADVSFVEHADIPEVAFENQQEKLNQPC
jgi:hypothetical protein